MARSEKHSKSKDCDSGTCISAEPGRGAVIEGCRRIIECSEILTRVRTARYTVEVCGQDLCTDTYNTDTVEVKGRISSIEFIPCGKRGKER